MPGTFLIKDYYSNPEKLCGKPKKLAEKYDDHLAVLEANHLERTLVWAINDRNKKAELDQLKAEKDKSLGFLVKEFKIQDDYDQLSLECAKRFDLTNHQIEKLTDQYDTKVHVPYDESLTAFAHLRLIQMKGLYHRLKMEFDLLDEMIQLEYQWWEDNPNFKKEDFYRYKISLSNYLSALFKKQDFDTVLDTIDQLEQKNKKTQLEEAMVLELKCVHKLLIYTNTYQFDAARDMIPEIKKGLQSHPFPISKRMAIWYNIGVLFFILEDFPRCQEWLSKVTKGHNTGTREDLRIFSNLLMVICHYELDEDDKMDKLIRAIGRTKIKNDQLAPEDLEFIVLTNLKRIVSAPIFDRSTKLSEFISKLKSHKYSDGKKKTALFLDEFIVWAERPVE